MQILHLDLKSITPDYVELRYFTDNPNRYETRTLPTSQIADFATGLNYSQQALAILQRLQSPNVETVRRIINRVQQISNG